MATRRKLWTRLNEEEYSYLRSFAGKMGLSDSEALRFLVQLNMYFQSSGIGEILLSLMELRNRGQDTKDRRK